MLKPSSTVRWVDSSNCNCDEFSFSKTKLICVQMSFYRLWDVLGWVNFEYVFLPINHDNNGTFSCLLTFAGLAILLLSSIQIGEIRVIIIDFALFLALLGAFRCVLGH